LAEAILQIIYMKFHHQANNRCKFADGFCDSMIDNKDGHIPLPLIMFTCAALHHALLELQRLKAFIQKLPSQSWKLKDQIGPTTSTTRMMVVRTHHVALQLVAS
jgi:hypothetical protein